MTWRVSIHEPPEMLLALKNKEPIILAHWHGDEIPLLALMTRYRLATITSTSKDGEMMNTVVRLQGTKTSRGSSTRGGVTALKGLIRIVKDEGRNTSFAVDGPKGPRHKVKAGVFEFSRLLNSPIYAAGVHCDRAWVFHKAWNKSYFPKPFAKISFHWLGPVIQVSKEHDPRSEQLAELLADALHRSAALAVKKIAAPSSLG